MDPIILTDFDQLKPVSKSVVTAYLISDLHFRSKIRLEYEECIKNILKYANDLKDEIDFIVCLGDSLDGHDRIEMSAFHDVILLFEQLKDIAPLYILIGNHDRTTKTDFLSNISPFYALKYWPQTFIVDEPKTLTIKDQNFAFVPYVPHGKFHEALERLPEFIPLTAIFAHQEFRGAKSQGYCSSNGDVWTIDSPLVISGHFHDRQTPHENIVYIGSILQQKSNESPNKGLSIFQFDPDTTNWFFIPDLVPPSLIINTTSSKLSEIVSSLPNGRLRIVIEANGSEAMQLERSSTVSNLRRQGVKISYKTVLPSEIRPSEVSSFDEVSEPLPGILRQLVDPYDKLKQILDIALSDRQIEELFDV